MTRPLAILLLIGGSLVVSLGLFEVALRLVGYSAAPIVQPDQVRGWSLIPNVTGVTNSRGLRDRERAPEKGAGTFRIAVLGDSMAEGVQVKLEETFPLVLEAMIDPKACFGTDRIEVINFAVQGYGTGQQYLTLDQKVWAYDPDLVLLAAFPGNDVRDNDGSLKGLAYLPFYHLDEGALVLDQSFRNRSSFQLRKLGAKIIRFSRLAQWANQVRFKLKAQLRAWTDRRQTRSKGLGEAGIDNLVFMDPPPPDWALAWTLTEALVTQMHSDTQARGRRFAAAVLGTATEGHPDPQVAAALAAELGIEDLSYPRRRLAALGRRVGFPVLDLVAPLQRRAALNQVCLHGEPGVPPCTGHYTAAGHRVVAQALDEFLCGGS